MSQSKRKPGRPPTIGISAGDGRITVDLGGDLYKTAKKTCDESGSSLSELVRRAVKNHLEKK